MGFFNRKNKILDLTKKYQKDEEKIRDIKSELQPNTSTNTNEGLGFFASLASSAKNTKITQTYNESESSEEKKKKLAKRLIDITNKLEDISNQMYHLQQRVEVLERKNNTSGF